MQVAAGSGIRAARDAARTRPAADVSSLKVFRLIRLLQGERGDTMLEVLIATTLVGIAFAAIFGGLSTASLAAKQQSESVQLEAVLSQARQILEVEPFDATGAYASVTLPAPPCGAAVSKVVSQVTPVPTTQLQRITLQATCGSQTRVAETLKGKRAL